MKTLMNCNIGRRDTRGGDRGGHVNCNGSHEKGIKTYVRGGVPSVPLSLRSSSPFINLHYFHLKSRREKQGEKLDGGVNNYRRDT